ncbi:unnamed protein product [Euphydryas editha]|uniref:Uncharacterized protein n=1 Tax=Euphydryas editha TaxID=104508 RepID=A0AAU9U4Q2_EUPED|nr:unnamed protein product [Euphydryas editha]
MSALRTAPGCGARSCSGGRPGQRVQLVRHERAAHGAGLRRALVLRRPRVVLLVLLVLTEHAAARALRLPPAQPGQRVQLVRHERAAHGAGLRRALVLRRPRVVLLVLLVLTEHAAARALRLPPAQPGQRVQLVRHERAAHGAGLRRALVLRRPRVVLLVLLVLTEHAAARALRLPPAQPGQRVQLVRHERAAHGAGLRRALVLRRPRVVLLVLLVLTEHAAARALRLPPAQPGQRVQLVRHERAAHGAGLRRALVLRRPRVVLLVLLVLTEHAAARALRLPPAQPGQRVQLVRHERAAHGAGLRRALVLRRPRVVLLSQRVQLVRHERAAHGAGLRRALVLRRPRVVLLVLLVLTEHAAARALRLPPAQPGQRVQLVRHERAAHGAGLRRALVLRRPRVVLLVLLVLTEHAAARALRLPPAQPGQRVQLVRHERAAHGAGLRRALVLRRPRVVLLVLLVLTEHAAARALRLPPAQPGQRVQLVRHERAAHGAGLRRALVLRRPRVVLLVLLVLTEHAAARALRLPPAQPGQRVQLVRHERAVHGAGLRRALVLRRPRVVLLVLLVLTEHAAARALRLPPAQPGQRVQLVRHERAAHGAGLRRALVLRRPRVVLLVLLVLTEHAAARALRLPPAQPGQRVQLVRHERAAHGAGLRRALVLRRPRVVLLVLLVLTEHAAARALRLPPAQPGQRVQLVRHERAAHGAGLRRALVLRRPRVVLLVLLVLTEHAAARALRLPPAQPGQRVQLVRHERAAHGAGLRRALVLRRPRVVLLVLLVLTEHAAARALRLPPAQPGQRVQLVRHERAAHGAGLRRALVLRRPRVVLLVLLVLTEHAAARALRLPPAQPGQRVQLVRHERAAHGAGLRRALVLRRPRVVLLVLLVLTEHAAARALRLPPAQPGQRVQLVRHERAAHGAGLRRALVLRRPRVVLLVLLVLTEHAAARALRLPPAQPGQRVQLYSPSTPPRGRCASRQRSQASACSWCGMSALRTAPGCGARSCSGGRVLYY